jgi:hypothetical protein
MTPVARANARASASAVGIYPDDLISNRQQAVSGHEIGPVGLPTDCRPEETSTHGMSPEVLCDASLIHTTHFGEVPRCSRSVRDVGTENLLPRQSPRG